MSYFYHQGRKYRTPRKPKKVWLDPVDAMIIAVGIATIIFIHFVYLIII